MEQRTIKPTLSLTHQTNNNPLRKETMNTTENNENTLESETSNEDIVEVEALEPSKSRKELSWRALIVITVIGLAILASILGSLLQHQPRIERTSFSESSTGYCVKEYWKLSSVDIKASEVQGMDAVNYYKAKNPNASPAYKTACN